MGGHMECPHAPAGPSSGELEHNIYTARATPTQNSAPANVPDRGKCNCWGHGQHCFAACSKYQGRKPADRHAFIKRMGRCFRCLGAHLIKACAKDNCYTC